MQKWTICFTNEMQLTWIDCDKAEQYTARLEKLDPVDNRLLVVQDGNHSRCDKTRCHTIQTLCNHEWEMNDSLCRNSCWPTNQHQSSWTE
jgi:hypothetical protein